jgi:hypothetical protein
VGCGNFVAYVDGDGVAVPKQKKTQTSFVGGFP